MTAILSVLLAAATTAAMAYLGHEFHLAHFHVIAGIPVGAMAIGAAAAAGVALAVRLSGNYDTGRFRMLGYLAGLTAYVAVVVLDYLPVQARGAPRASFAPQLLSAASYLVLLVEQGAKAASAQLPQWVRIPPQISFWIGMVRLAVEVVGTMVATGWSISLLSGVPFCLRNRRFYELKQLVESAHVAAVHEWETAVHQRRPIEARAILARARAARVEPQDRSWMRIVVHQCPVCFAGRVRIERRRRAHGLVRTEPGEELVLDEARGSALLAT